MLPSFWFVPRWLNIPARVYLGNGVGGWLVGWLVGGWVGGLAG